MVILKFLMGAFELVVRLIMMFVIGCYGLDNHDGDI